MAFRINTNVDALNGSRQLGITQALVSQNLARLASGSRINSAADDAAGLAISEILNTQIRGANQAAANAQDGISLIQTADGALSQTADSLQRIRELTVEAGNGTLSPEQRGAIQSEIADIQQSIDQTANNTQFNGLPLLNGTNTSVTLQTGPNSGNTNTVNLPNATTAALGIGPGQVDVSSPAAANASLSNIDQAIDRVNTARGDLGAQSNALQNVTATLNVSSENQASARSRIADLDYAQAITQQTRDSILSDLNAAVLAHANLNSQGVLRLLG